MKAFHEVRNYNSDLMVWCSGYENISFVAHWQKEIELVYVQSGEASFHVMKHDVCVRSLAAKLSWAVGQCFSKRSAKMIIPVDVRRYTGNKEKAF